jgi:hypothetical protein
MVQEPADVVFFQLPKINPKQQLFNKNDRKEDRSKD